MDWGRVPGINSLIHQFIADGKQTIFRKDCKIYYEAQQTGSRDMTIISISQSMYFPWLGHFELMRLSDVYFHYDDVQLSRGFYQRVQVITNGNSDYMSVSIANKKQKQLVSSSILNGDKNWAIKHRNKLKASLSKARYFQDSIQIFDSVHGENHKFLHSINRSSINKILNYLNLPKKISVQDANGVNSAYAGSKRLLSICKDFGAKIYLTGHGALNYLDHELFEKNQIEVHYVKYRFSHYSNLNPHYSPYVTALDPIAYLGSSITNSMQSDMVYWKEALRARGDLRAK